MTEKDTGSDAANIKSYVEKVEGGYILNGDKRWIGNADGDLITCWAKNRADKNRI